MTRCSLFGLSALAFAAGCSGSGGGSTGPKSSLTVTGQVIGFGPIAGDFNFKQGDTIRIGIRATSNRSIEYVGIQYGSSPAIRDSLWATKPDTLDIMALATLIVAGNSGGQLPIRIFSKDVAGSTVEITPGNGDHTWLYPVLSVSADTVDDSPAPGVLVIDDARQRLYLTENGTELRAYDLGTHSLISSLTLAAYINSLAISASGDTLLATLNGRDSLTVVDVSGVTPIVTTVPLVDATLGSLAPDGAELLGGDSAIVSVTCSLCSRGRALLLVHLASGVHTDIGYVTASGADAVVLAASGDGSKVFIERLIGYTHPVTAQVYDVTRRAFTAELQPAFLGPGADNGAQFSVNSAGTRMLTGEVLFNAPFASDTGFDAPYGSVRAILSKSGNLIYVWVAGGVMELRAADLSAVALFATTNPGELPLLFVTGDGKQVVMAVNNRLIFLALPSGLVAPDVMEMGNAGMAAHLSFVDQIKGFGRR